MDSLKEILSLYWVGGPFYIFTCIFITVFGAYLIVSFIHYLEEKEII